MKVEFMADKVTIKTGRVDGSAIVSFEVGEYQLKNLKELVALVNKALKVTVDIEDER